jgi:hypothetical protein
MELYYVYGTDGVIVGYFALQVLRRRFDPFAPIWLFLVGYLQVYVVQALSYHEWAMRARGQELVTAANARAFWVLLLMLGVYSCGAGGLLSRLAPRPPRAWSVVPVAVLAPLLIIWGLICSGLVLRAGGADGTISAEESLLRSFPFVMLVGGVLLVVTGRSGGHPRPWATALGLLVGAAYVLIWMFNAKRSHSLIGVLATVCAFYVTRRRRPSWPVLLGTAFTGALVVTVAIGWRGNKNYEKTPAGFVQFLGDFQVSAILKNLNIEEPDAAKPTTHETDEYGGFLLMMDAVPGKSDYDYGENYLRLFSTFIPRVDLAQQAAVRPRAVDQGLGRQLGAEARHDLHRPGHRPARRHAAQRRGLGHRDRHHRVGAAAADLVRLLPAPRDGPLGPGLVDAELLQRLVHGRLRRPAGLVLLQLGLHDDARPGRAVGLQHAGRPRGRRARGLRRVGPRGRRRGPFDQRVSADVGAGTVDSPASQDGDDRPTEEGIMSGTSEAFAGVGPPPGGARPHPRPVRLSIHARIDVCRGLFAYFVVIAHALEVSWGVHPVEVEKVPVPVRHWLACTVGSGIYWVMGFFVISGYCIHLSVARLRDDGRFPLRVYLWARLTRILPLYYAALAFTLLVEWLIAPARPLCWEDGRDGPTLLAQAFVVQQMGRTYGAFAASWSITNEVFYYGLYGLLCTLAAGRGDRPMRAGLALCLAVAAVTQGLYATVARTPTILGLGMLFGLGINWFLGVLLAEHGPALARSRRAAALARSGSRCSCWRRCGGPRRACPRRGPSCSAARRSRC